MTDGVVEKQQGNARREQRAQVRNQESAAAALVCDVWKTPDVAETHS
jgi:LmbE family N-acetylglucosaminyl deacetylase